MDEKKKKSNKLDIFNEFFLWKKFKFYYMVKHES